MGGEIALPMWVLLMLLLAQPARAMCPSKCKCNDDTLEASCRSAVLEVVPIQLNPEARHIDLSLNKIASVHYTLRIYSNLLTLDLSSNKIQTLGNNNFDSQRNLEHLNLSRNEIETLGKESLKGLRNLTELDFSHNHIEELKAVVFRELHSLEILKMTNNQLVYLEEGLFKSSRQLKELYLGYNQFLELPTTAIADANKLQVLSLSHNLIVAIEDEEMPNLGDLKTFELDSNIIGDIGSSALAGLIALESLDLSDNNFTTIPTASLAKLSNLTVLRFSENCIESVPPVAFRGLFQLKSLHLNKLDLLTKVDGRAFVDNIHLEEVCLDENIAMHSFPTRLFHGNPRLSHISVRNNRLPTLEVSHFPLDQLKSLKLGGNPFQCNCSLLWLWRLIQEQMTRVNNRANGTREEAELMIDIDEIRCAGPEPLANTLLSKTTESQVDCSLGWVAVASVTLFACLLLGAGSVLLYFGPMKKRLKKPDLPSRESSVRPDGATLGLAYDDPRVDKYIIGPPLIPEYRALPPWDTFTKPNDMDIYANIKARPHIVYV